jgi:hypothetical protein
MGLVESVGRGGLRLVVRRDLKLTEVEHVKELSVVGEEREVVVV